MKAYGITTVDNPYNPLTDFDNWYIYDLQKGYCTCERLAAITPNIHRTLGVAKQEELLLSSIEQLVKEGAFDKYNNFVELKKVEVEVDENFNVIKQKQ